MQVNAVKICQDKRARTPRRLLFPDAIKGRATRIRPTDGLLPRRCKSGWPTAQSGLYKTGPLDGGVMRGLGRCSGPRLVDSITKRDRCSIRGRALSATAQNNAYHSCASTGIVCRPTECVCSCLK